jgi:HlyD family secretion protein
VPIQAIVGGAEGGSTRKLFVLTPTGPQEREVTLGMFNEKMVEVRTGVAEGEQVVLNPKALLAEGSGQVTGKDAGRMPSGPPSSGGGEKKGKGMKGPPGGGGGPGGGSGGYSGKSS